MKSVLLYANVDPGLEARLQAALDVTRLFDGHLTCVQVTPQDAFIIGDPFGGVFALPTVVAQVQRVAEEQRERVQARLADEDVGWSWRRFDGAPAQVIVDRARLADLIVLSLPGEEGGGAQALVADVLVHARAPVLAVPSEERSFDGGGIALVAWDGSVEASHALRLTMPVLQRAAAVHVLTITEGESEFPATDACRYLALHDIEAELHEWPRQDRSTAEALIDAAGSVSADYLVMGAYGHTRLREAVLGGATRDMLHASPVPLLLAH